MKALGGCLSHYLQGAGHIVAAPPMKVYERQQQQQQQQHEKQ